MSVPAHTSHDADPVEQGRLGQDVEEILHGVAYLAGRAGTGDDEDEKRRALQMAGFAAAQLYYLADRKEEVGQLCSAVEEELRLAESVLSVVSELALMWTHLDDEHPFPLMDEKSEMPRPRMPRDEYVRTVGRYLRFISARFPGQTAKRWRAMAWEDAWSRPLSGRIVL